MKTESLQRAARTRLVGEQPSPLRSAVAAATAGGAVAALVYKVLRA